MSKLNQEEPRNHNVWLKCFIKAMKESLETGLRFYPRDDDVIMLQQIREMIQSHANLEQGVAQSQGKVTEEWIEEKAKELREGTYIAEPIHGYGLDLDIAKDFIRKIIEEIK